MVVRARQNPLTWDRIKAFNKFQQKKNKKNRKASESHPAAEDKLYLYQTISLEIPDVQIFEKWYFLDYSGMNWFPFLSYLISILSPFKGL